MISKSYPFLSIARKHGVPYGDVLAAADHIIHDRRVDDPQRAVDMVNKSERVLYDIADACRELTHGAPRYNTW